MNQARKKKYSNIYQNILSLLLKFVLDKGYSLLEGKLEERIDMLRELGMTQQEIVEKLVDRFSITILEAKKYMGNR